MLEEKGEKIPIYDTNQYMNNKQHKKQRYRPFIAVLKRNSY